MTLSMRPDDRGGFSSMEKWSTSGIGLGNHHQQVLNVLEPASTGLNDFYSNSHLLQPQCSIFPQLIQNAEQDSALVHAFTQAKTDFRDAHNDVNALEDDTLLMKSSNTSSSMVESSTSDEECTAPETIMHCLSALGGGSVSSAVADILDRTGGSGASMMAQDQDFYRLHHPAESTSPGGRSLSPCGWSDESLHGADAYAAALMAGQFRRSNADDEEWIDQMQAPRVHKGEQAPAFHDGYCAPSSLLGASPSYDSGNQAPTLTSAGAPVLQRSAVAGGGATVVDMDSMQPILYRHVSQPVPSLEEIASSRPKRRNVRISNDPQSVAARHRRERISDRMRVLQRLVPGGTKMDTAAMLDEAIHYVKFLKLQLQTLEQIGNTNNGVALGSYVQAQAGAGEGSLAGRPFNLNSAASFQARPLNNNITGSYIQASQQGRQPHQWAWTI